jgi:hypothetical protein
MRNRSKVVAYVVMIALLFTLWLYLVLNLTQFELVFVITGCVSLTLFVAYAIIMLSIITLEKFGK